MLRPEPPPLDLEMLTVGEAFNPHQIFFGMLVPDPLARSPLLSHGAKLAYASLKRFAGAGGRCFPSVRALADSIARSRRQTIRYLGELRQAGFIRRIRHGLNHSNSYLFLWHPLFEQAKPLLSKGRAAEAAQKALIPKEVTSVSLLEVSSAALQEVPSMAHKENQLNRSREEPVDRSNEPPVFVENTPVPPPAWTPGEFQAIERAISVFRYTNGEQARVEKAMLRRIERIGRIYAATPFHIAAILFRKYQLVSTKPSLAPDGPAWFAAVIETHLFEQLAPPPPPRRPPAPPKPPRQDPEGQAWTASIVASLAAGKRMK